MYIAKAADGSLRDGLSLLDQCVAFHYGKLLTYENALEVLGAVDSSVFSRMFNAVADGRTRDCITELEEIVIQGRELGQFVTDFIWYLRNLLLVQSADDPEGLVDLSEENLKQLKADAVRTDGNTLMRYIRVFSDLSSQLRYASQKRVLLEVALIRLTHPAMGSSFPDTSEHGSGFCFTEDSSAGGTVRGYRGQRNQRRPGDLWSGRQYGCLWNLWPSGAAVSRLRSCRQFAAVPFR